ncbi:hypothetical protein F4779DRAFT_213981 [Xylariaceae sp. FL0662B]|nr:hypothetical protein F4779DRAFT_213981 [Xylariaceae sp. FL0662B]
MSLNNSMDSLINEILPDAGIRDLLDRELAKPNVGPDRPVMQLTGSSGTGKSTHVTCGIAAMLSRNEPGRVTLCVQHEPENTIRNKHFICTQYLTKKIKGLERLRSLARLRGLVGCGGHGDQWPNNSGKMLSYVTYSTLLWNMKNNQTLLDDVQCVIFDEAQRQTIDQELVMCLMCERYRDLRVRVIVMTAYPHSGVFESFKFPSSFRVNLDDVTNTPAAPMLRYVADAREDLYESWVLGFVLGIFQGNRQANVLVFLESESAMSAFAKRIRADPSCPANIFELSGSLIPLINRAVGPKLILGFADFGSRWWLDDINYVFHPGTRLLRTLDKKITKDIYQRHQLTGSEAQFLRNHATAPEAIVYAYMTEGDATKLRVDGRITPDWSYGTLRDYYLKAIFFFPNRTLKRGDANRIPLRLHFDDDNVMWAVYQLSVLRLISLDWATATQETNRFGARAAQLCGPLSKLGLDFFSACYVTFICDKFSRGDSGLSAQEMLFLCSMVQGPAISPKRGSVGSPEIDEVEKYLSFCCDTRIHLGDPWIWGVVHLGVPTDREQPANFTLWERNCSITDLIRPIVQEHTGVQVGNLDADFIREFNSHDTPNYARARMTFLDVWGCMQLFNLAFVTEAEEKPWKARDICSGMQVELDTNSFLDARAILQIERMIGDYPYGIYVIYRTVEKMPDGRYVISNLTYLEVEALIPIFNCCDNNLDNLLKSPFRED